MKFGKYNSRFDVVVREWVKGRVIKQKVITPFYDTNINELEKSIRTCFIKK